MVKETLIHNNRNFEQGKDDTHFLPENRKDRSPGRGSIWVEFDRGFYDYNDLDLLQSSLSPMPTYSLRLSSIDELMERDKNREKDGFPRKIRLGRLVKPGRGGKDKIIIVPTTVEEKFIHDPRRSSSDEKNFSGGSGDGEEGEVIGEEEAHDADGGGEGGAGRGQGGEHEIESSAYDLGRILTEKFKLPNLKDKGKKRSLTRYTYDLTDRHRGSGQILDKKATLRKIIETNINLGNLKDADWIDTAGLLVSPTDKVYRALSKEKDYESQAMVFLLRDYSGSMYGKPTEMIVSQHVLIYSWLLYQYDKQVETRYVLHDEEAREVPDFHTYYNLTVAGGTRVVSAFRLVNEIVEKGKLDRNYNIYVFYGTDGDDWDSDGSGTIPEIKKMLNYSNRVGITITRNPAYGGMASTVERYLRNSRILVDNPNLIRMDTIGDSDPEERLIEGIRNMIS